MKKGRKNPLVECFACFVIPAYTLLFAGSVEWFSTNFSVIAVTGEDHFRGFFLWGVLVGGYFLGVLGAVAQTLPRRGKWVVWALTAGGWLLLAGALLLPYLPQFLPKIARLHVIFAACACVLLMLALLAVVLAGRRRSPSAYQPMLRVWGWIAGFSGALFVLGGMITTALEVFFILSAVWFARRLFYLRKI